jgi:hypothetical protein
MSFKNHTMEKYPLIINVHYMGAGPRMGVGFQLSEEADFSQIEVMFNDLYVQLMNAYSDLELMHHDRHGDIGKISISFFVDPSNDLDAYMFEFKGDVKNFGKENTWILNHNNTSIEYITNPNIHKK